MSVIRHSDLNAEQEQAIKTDGVSLVFAGAGSGKTKTLTYKIAQVLLRGFAPQKVLALTFTNKAASEMRQRVTQLLSQAGLRIPLAQWHTSEGLFVGTFHAWGAQFLRRELGRDISIYDEEDSLALMKEIVQSTDQGLEPKFILKTISHLKNRCGSLNDLRLSTHHIERQVADYWQVYESKKRERQAFDFDDLMVVPLQMLNEQEKILKRWQYEYVLVDEFQDTNLPQYLLVKLLVKQHGNLFVVGDDYQAIYGFRGTNYRNILELEQDFSVVHTHLLTRNYRSTQKILEAANQLIQNNRLQKHKELWTQNDSGEEIQLYTTHNGDGEAELVSSLICDLCLRYRPSEIAILYRVNFLSRALEEKLLAKKIPYRIYGGVSFYQRKEIKDLLAYLRLLANPRDLVSLRRVLNVPPRGLGPKSQKLILSKPVEIIESWLTGNLTAHDETELVKIGERFLSAYTYGRQSMLGLPTLSEFIKDVLQGTNYLAYLENDLDRLQNISEFINVASNLDALPFSEAFQQFLDMAALWQAHDETKNKEAVQLMSVHLAKGLEFKVVFIIGLEEDLFPHHKSILEEGLSEQGGIEEERRLAYVAITRAKERLYLSYANQRRAWGSTLTTTPSRFLREIPGLPLIDSFQVSLWD